MVVIEDAVMVFENVDKGIFLFFNQLHTEFFDHFMSIYSNKLVWIPMYMAIAYVLFRNFSPKAAFLCMLALALTITLSDQVCANVLKPFVERLRPSNLDNPFSSSVHIVDGYRGGRYGFPSCHASNSSGLAVFMLLLFKKKQLSVFLMIWAVLMCYSRVYLGVHYPGDVFVGMLVGAGIASCIFWLLRKFVLRQELLPNTVRYTSLPVLMGALTILGITVYALLYSFSVLINH